MEDHNMLFDEDDIKAVKEHNKKIEDIKRKTLDKLINVFSDNVINEIGKTYSKLDNIRINTIYNEFMSFKESIKSMLEYLTDDEFVKNNNRFIVDNNLNKLTENLRVYLEKNKKINTQKILVFSCPHEDYHATSIVDSKDMDFYEAIIGCNSWRDIDDEDIVEVLNDKLYDRIKLFNDSNDFENMSVVKKYFKHLVKNDSISLYEFSNNLIDLLPNDRGAWCSYAWVG